MTTVTIQLPPETTEKLRQQASQLGKSLEAYLQGLAEDHALGGEGMASAAPSVTELDRQLDELSAELPALPQLPIEFSRSDIYAEHD